MNILNCPQTKVKLVADNCCLFMCYLYCVGFRTVSTSQWLLMLSQALDAKLIDDECTVLNAEKLIDFFTKKKYGVSKKSISGIAGITSPTPVKYAAAGYIPHWVVVENGEIVFNPLLNSKSVTNGKPCDARILVKK